MDIWDVWDRRLREARDRILTLPRETRARRLDDRGRPTGVPVVLPAGNQVRYAGTGYDAMRLDQCWHHVEVLSGEAAGLQVDVEDSVNWGPLPWEG
jgi:hypothetical protein